MSRINKLCLALLLILIFFSCATAQIIPPPPQIIQPSPQNPQILPQQIYAGSLDQQRIITTNQPLYFSQRQPSQGQPSPAQGIPNPYGYPDWTAPRMDIPRESFLFGALPRSIGKTLIDIGRFSTEDPAVLAWVHFSSVQGTHNLTWMWFRDRSPDNYQINNETINCSRDGTIAYSGMYIKDNPPENMLGEWGVEIFLDGEFIEGKSFEIDETEPSENKSFLPLNWENLSKGSSVIG